MYLVRDLFLKKNTAKQYRHKLRKKINYIYKTFKPVNPPQVTVIAPSDFLTFELPLPIHQKGNFMGHQTYAVQPGTRLRKKTIFSSSNYSSWQGNAPAEVTV